MTTEKIEIKEEMFIESQQVAIDVLREVLKTERDASMRKFIRAKIKTWKDGMGDHVPTRSQRHAKGSHFSFVTRFMQSVGRACGIA